MHFLVSNYAQSIEIGAEGVCGSRSTISYLKPHKASYITFMIMEKDYHGWKLELFITMT